MSIDIYASNLTTKKATINAALSSNLHQSLNGECTFDLTMPGRLLSGVVLGDEVRVGELYFTVSRITRASRTAGAQFSLNCEHISYALADLNMIPGTYSGTPAEVMARIVNGTHFSVGTVTVTGTVSIEVSEDVSKRDLLQQLAAKSGGEISYYERQINLTPHVGSSVAVNLADSENVKGVSVTLDSTQNSQSYSVELSRLLTLHLGDAVRIQYSSLELDVTTRVITLDYDIFHPMAIRMVCGTYIPTYYQAVQQTINEVEETVSGEIEEKIEIVLLRAQKMDFSGWDVGEFYEILDDGTTIYYTVLFNQNGDPVLITDGDHSCEIVW